MRVCLRAKFTTSVEGGTFENNILSRVYLNDNDGATWAMFEVGADGTAEIDFQWKAKEALHTVPMLTNRWQLHCYASCDVTGSGIFHFPVATYHFHVRDILLRNCEVHGATYDGKGLPDDEARTVANCSKFDALHNFQDNRVAMELIGTKIQAAGTKIQPADISPTAAPAYDPVKALASFDRLRKAGAIRESVLWKSPKHNKVIDECARNIHKELVSSLVIDEAHGVGNLQELSSAHPMFGEHLVYTDIEKGLMSSRQCYAPNIVAMVAVITGFNLNGVNVEDAEHLTDHHLCYILSYIGTFFTCCPVAGEYVSNVTVAKAQAMNPDSVGSHLGLVPTPPVRRRQTKNTEDMSRSFSDVNVGKRRITAGDCEDVTAAGYNAVKGVVELEETRRRTPAKFEALYDNPLLAKLTSKARVGATLAVRLLYGILSPFRERLAKSPTHDAPPPLATDDPLPEPNVVVDMANNLGIARGASADQMQASYGGHSYGHFALFKTKVKNSLVGTPRDIAALAGEHTEMITLEGTARVETLHEHTPQENVWKIPVTQAISVDKIPVAIQQGWQPIAFEPKKGMVMIERDISAQQLLTVVEQSLPCLQVEGRSNSRQTIMWAPLLSENEEGNEAGNEAGVAQIASKHKLSHPACMHVEHDGGARLTVHVSSRAARSQRYDHSGHDAPSHVMRHVNKTVTKNGQNPFVNVQNPEARDSFYQKFVVQRNCIVTEKLSDGQESLGTFFPSYYEGKKGVSLVHVQGKGLDPTDFQESEEFKLASLSCMYSPMNLDSIANDVTEAWLPIDVVAPVRGPTVNDFMNKFTPITVAEASTEHGVRKKQWKKAQALAATGNVDFQSKGQPHEVLAWRTMHSSLHTVLISNEILH
eukprot:3939386-Rhodomonas_salina.12